jgi:hypothetical protein
VHSWSGTAGYITPETKRDGIFGVKSDIYGAGMILLRILTPHLPGAVNLNLDLLLVWTQNRRERIDQLKVWLQEFISSCITNPWHFNSRWWLV